MTTAKTWAEYHFPDWVPEKVRAHIRDFWREEWSRSPASWHEGAIAKYNMHPPLGAHVDAQSMTNSGLPRLVGRWVPAWNNIGFVVLDDGTFRLSSTCGICILEPA